MTMIAKMPPLEKRFSKQEVLEAIDKSCGVMTRCCNLLDCTVPQLMKYIAKNGLEHELEKARDKLASNAENTLLDALSSADEKVRLDAAKFILKLRGHSSGWMSAPSGQEISVSNGNVTVRQIFFGEDQ